MKLKDQLRNILMISLLLIGCSGQGQQLSKGACEIRGNRIVFTINLNWTDSQLQEFTEQYDLDSLVIAGISEGQGRKMINGIEWQYKKGRGESMQISKKLNNGIDNIGDLLNYFLLDWTKQFDREDSDEMQVDFGSNQFSSYPPIRLGDTVVLFLPGFINAQSVFISGSFNQWSTYEHPLKKTEGGWAVKIKIHPGQYLYKYIVDGQWILDPSNLQTKDEAGIKNSVFYQYNHEFVLEGYSSAQQVYLAGSFNNFKPDEIPMQKIDGQWVLPCYLDEGTHEYKFIVDGQWIVDPANPKSRDDGKSNMNSILELGQASIFSLKGYEEARSVYLTGTFNNWNERALNMEQTTDGWQIEYVLGPGNYQYKYIVDGKWMYDPENPYTTGSGDYMNSVRVIQSNYEFSLSNFEEAETIIISGNFNNWNPDGYRMLRTATGWSFPIFLKPGKYTYKFIVDGEWILDPGNDLWEENEHGTGNSVLWIEEPTR